MRGRLPVRRLFNPLLEKTSQWLYPAAWLQGRELVYQSILHRELDRLGIDLTLYPLRSSASLAPCSSSKPAVGRPGVRPGNRPECSGCGARPAVGSGSGCAARRGTASRPAPTWQRVHGQRHPAGSAGCSDALAEFFAALPALGAEQVELAELNLHASLHQDLLFLQRSGLLGARRHAGLLASAERLRPERIWLGADYLDPVLKNFVINQDGLFVIDIESFDLRAALGIGLAKSCLHWLEPYRQEFIAAVLARPGVPDFRAQLPYVELCFLAGWSKRKLLTGMAGRVRAQRFDRFLQD